jgi:hypothetical protein
MFAIMTSSLEVYSDHDDLLAHAPRGMAVSASGVFAASSMPPRISSTCIAAMLLYKSSDRHSTSSTAVAVTRYFSDFEERSSSSCMTAQSLRRARQ